MVEVCNKHFLFESQKKSYMNCKAGISGLHSHQIQTQSLGTCYFKFQFIYCNKILWLVCCEKSDHILPVFLRQSWF